MPDKPRSRRVKARRETRSGALSGLLSVCCQCWDGAGAFRLSRTNLEISSDTADSGTETEEARSMASRPNRDSPGQSLQIRTVGMSYIHIVCEIGDHNESLREGLQFTFIDLTTEAVIGKYCGVNEDLATCTLCRSLEINALTSYSRSYKVQPALHLA